VRVLYSDLHLRPERLEDCEKVLNEIFDIAVKLRKKHKQPVRIVNGGDTFHTRGLIRTICFDRLYWHYDRWYREGFAQDIIVGNHDQEDRAGEIHPMKVFANFDGWNVVDKPMVIEGVAHFPYMPKDKIQEAILSLAKGKEAFKDAIVHWGICGAMRNDRNKDTDGVPVEWLKGFRNVFSGHYHYRNKFENVQYIGSPLQQNFGEMGQEKGIIVYDQEKSEASFVEIKGTPKHHEVQVHWDEDKERIDGDLKAIQAQDFVRIKAVGDSEKCARIDRDSFSKRLKCNNISVEREVREKHFSRLKIDSGEILAPESLMKKYVEFIECDLNKDRLIRVGLDLIGA
jgi:DNA repair exonuclease SbcCD nuclease subunit